MINKSSNTINSTLEIFSGGGEMGARMREFDWTKTPLGAVETWSQSLKTAVSIILNSRFSMFVWWGQELTYLYNDAYQPTLGIRHPAALGRSAREVWAEIWETLGPQAEAVIECGQASWNEELLLFLERKGFPEETYHTFSYSPIASDDGVGGLFCAVTEDTVRVLSRRRLQTLRDLGERALTEAKTVEQATDTAAMTLAENLNDVPFALIYLLDETGKTAKLTEAFGITRGTKAAPENIEIDGAEDVWDFRTVLESGNSNIVTDLEPKFGKLSAGAWADDYTRQAVVVPLAKTGIQDFPYGFLVAGTSPRLEFDDDYRSFLELAGGHIATAVSNARALEEERRRAEALAELNRAKTEFFSNVSHEFRTPLTLMLGTLEEFLQNHAAQTTDSGREQIETAHRNSLRLLKLVNNLLDFSRVEANRLRADFEPTDLSQFTAELASAFRSAIEHAGIKLTINCLPLSEEVFVDREMWEKIVFNLISNAYKFTFAGEIKISLHQSGPFVFLEIADTGTGISAGELPHIFERFYRATNAQSRTHEGTGIGLSLVQELVRLHGGTIGVESEVGRGTTFTVKILTGDSHLPPERVKRENNAKKTLLPNSLRAQSFLNEIDFASLSADALLLQDSAKEDDKQNGNTNGLGFILLADDNADMREYVGRLLTQKGYEVLAVPDGEAALKALEERKPDLVLSDIMMPRLDGFGLLKAIRTSERTREIPVIMLSARAGEESKIDGLEAGADDYLVKPFSVKELLARVRVNFEMARIRRQSVERERQLRMEADAAKQHTEKILSSINDAFAICDNQWRYTYVNDAALKMSGLSRKDIVGKTMWELYPNVVGTFYYHEMQRAMRGNNPTHFEYFYPTMNRWFAYRVYPTADGISFFVTDITEGKQAEEKLLESQRFIQSIVESAPTLLYIYDFVEERNIYISGQVEAMLGLPPKDIQETGSQLFAELFHPDDLPKVKAHHAHIRESKQNQVFEIEYRMKHLNGDWRWFHSRDVIYRRQTNGDPAQILGSAQDITERKAVEEELHHTQARLESALDAGLAGTFYWDIERDHIITDENMMRYFSLSDRALKEGVALKEVLPSIYEEDRPKVEKALTDALESTNIYTVEYRVNHSDGQIIWLSARGAVERDKSGKPIALPGFAVDITKIKEAEEAIRESEANFRDLADSMPQIVWANDAKGNIAYFNKQWFDYTGLTAEESFRNSNGAIQSEDKAHVQEVWLQNLRQGEPFEYKLRLRRSDGIYLWHLVRCVPVRNDTGQITRWFGTSTNIDDQVRVAQKLEHLFQREQFLRAKAEEANRLKDEFLATVSHELRTPLNSILGWSVMARNQITDSEKVNQSLAIIERSARNQNQLISDLLDVSRIITGKLNLEAGSVELTSIIEAAIDTTRPALDAKGIRLTKTFEPSAQLVSGDAGRLQQVIWNLLANAAKFTPSGGEIEIRLQSSDGQAQIKVIDNGEGIEHGFLPFIFDRFRQEDGGISRRHGGLGLGLAIVRYITEMHGGTVEVESKGKNLGSTFTVKLPLLQPEYLVTGKPLDQPNNEGGDISNHRLLGVRVLVVDDDPSSCELAKMILGLCGANVVTAESTREGLKKLQSVMPDVIVSDIGMPESDGYDFIYKVRELSPDKGGRVPAIALTAYTRSEDSYRALTEGFQAHLSKPVEPDSLIETVANLINKNASL